MTYRTAKHFAANHSALRPDRTSATAQLLVHTARQKTAIHREHVAGNKTGRIGSQEHARAHKFFDFAESLHRRTQKKFLRPWSSVQQCRDQLRTEHAESDRVNADTVPRPLNGKR